MPRNINIIKKVIDGNPFVNGAAVVSSVGGAYEYNDVNPDITSFPSGQVKSEFNEINYYGPQKGFGYEYTAAFVDRTTGTAGVSASGTNVQYSTQQANSGVWLRFGFDPDAQVTNDQPYWSDPVPEEASGVGLFGGSYLPKEKVDSVFDFSYSGSNYTPAGTTSDGEPYTEASGSFDFTDLTPGSFLQVRFDFNVLPQVANTTVQVALIFQTRDANDDPTHTFALTAQPVFFGVDAVGKTFLNRPILTAYYASEEDVNARALLAIKSNNLVQIQPLATLCIINKR